MRCDNCHEREAVIELTQIADDKKVEVHLCEKCAAEKGISTSASLSNSSQRTWALVSARSSLSKVSTTVT